MTSNWAKDDRSYLYWRNSDYRECTYEVLKFTYPHRTESGRWNELLFVSIYFTYFILQSPDFDRRDADAEAAYDEMEKLFIKMVQDFGDTIKDVSMQEKARWYTLTRIDVCNRFNFLIEKTPWNDFLKYIDNKYNVNTYDLLYIK